MTKTAACLVIAGLMLAAGTAVYTTPAQDRTMYPGEPTQGKVWIQNRGDEEAVPVRIRSVDRDGPVRVLVSGTPTVTIGNANLPTRTTRQGWEYRGVPVSTGQDLVSVLNAAGSDGWEATGIAIPAPSGTFVLMKRPR